MLVIKPEFYDDFKCIADKCSDCCCVGWEIVVDNETREKYKNIKGEFGEKIRASLVKDEDNEICFELDENERCPFLNKNNLCDIIINCGEDALCSICSEHPRFYNEFSEVIECGLGLCCEEVCRLLLENDRPLVYIEEVLSEDESSMDFLLDDEEYFEMYNIKVKMFEILRRDMNFNDKIIALKEIVEKEINERIELDSDEKILSAYEKTEPINKEWTEYFYSLKNNISDYLEKEKPFDKSTNGNKIYSKIISYIIFRHLSNSVYEDSDLKGYFNFCVSAVRFIKLCDIKTYCETNTLTLKNRIENVKRWSKQIEYSDLNVDILIF